MNHHGNEHKNPDPHALRRDPAHLLKLLSNAMIGFSKFCIFTKSKNWRKNQGQSCNSVRIEIKCNSISFFI